MGRGVDHRLTGGEREIGLDFSFTRDKGGGRTKDYHFIVRGREGDRILADLFIVGTWVDGCGGVCIMRPPISRRSHPGGHAFPARRISLPVGTEVGWWDPSD